MDNKRLIPGKTYSIEIDDCCISGKFTSLFICYVHEADDGEVTFSPENMSEYDAMLFANSYIQPYWGGWRIDKEY